MNFDALYATLTSEKIFLEYLNFLKNMPNLINSEKNKIVKTVEQELRTSNLMKNASHFDYKSLIAKKESNLIDLLSIKLGYSLKILYPPVTECILCERNLLIVTAQPHLNHNPTPTQQKVG